MKTAIFTVASIGSNCPFSLKLARFPPIHANSGHVTGMHILGRQISGGDTIKSHCTCLTVPGWEPNMVGLLFCAVLQGRSERNLFPSWNLLAVGKRKSAPIPEIDVLWITGGLSCDGDTIAMTAATQPSIEDIVLGGIPWIPKVNFHNPFLAFENGDEFLKPFHLAAEGQSRPFILVLEGSVPDETNKKEGYWASFGTDSSTGQPITTCDWIDRLAPKAWAVIAAGTCATYGGIHAMEGNPTGCMGLPDYLGWKWRSRAEIPIVCVPGCPVAAGQFYGDAALSALYGGGARSHDSAG